MLSTRTTRPLKRLALAVTLAALAAPTAQGRVDPSAYNLVRQSAQSVPLMSEHSASQNGTGQRSTSQPVPLITEHSAGQNGTGQPTGVLRSVTASMSASAPNGFKWRDAGVGAGVAFAAMLLAVAATTVILRRGRRRLAGF